MELLKLRTEVTFVILILLLLEELNVTDVFVGIEIDPLLVLFLIFYLFVLEVELLKLTNSTDVQSGP